MFELSSTDAKAEPGAYVLAVCQFEPTFLNVEANLEKMAAMCRQAAIGGAQVVLFPECCVTGYGVGARARDMAALAEPLTTGATTRMAELATQLGIVIIFGLPERRGSNVYNAAVCLSPDSGVLYSYHKMHLWEADAEVFTPGAEFHLAQAPAGKLGSLICFDLEFPEAPRILAMMGADLLAVSTANMRPWEEAQRVYARARALENSVYVAVANCLGQVGNAVFFGGSIVVDPYGRVLAEAGDAEAILLARVAPSRCGRARQELGYWRNRQPDRYGPLLHPPAGSAGD